MDAWEITRALWLSPASVVAVGHVVYRLLPTFSKRAMKYRVQMERAKAARNR